MSGNKLPCPCGSGKNYNECCLPYITGSINPPTAEALMRSRYSAYVNAEIDYILDTHHPETKDEISREATKEWAEESEWISLEIISIKDGTENDKEGFVEFAAKYRTPDRAIVTHHELSHFVKRDGKWFFLDGKQINNPVRRETPKVGRNDPCPCGSGKKYKNCCGR